MFSWNWKLDAGVAENLSRRDLLSGMVLLGIALLAGSAMPAMARQARKRVIVQFRADRNRDSEIRRILGALRGLPHEVLTRFEITPAIVIAMDDRGMKRLRRLPGIRLQLDGLSAPN